MTNRCGRNSNYSAQLAIANDALWKELMEGIIGENEIHGEK